MSSICGTAEDSITVFLCHCDGVNDGTTFTDVATGGSAPHTITAVADAHTDTSEKKFGTASLQCDGTGDYISMSPNGDFVFGTDPYTIDLWAKMSDNQSAFYTFGIMALVLVLVKEFGGGVMLLEIIGQCLMILQIVGNGHLERLYRVVLNHGGIMLGLGMVAHKDFI